MTVVRIRSVHAGAVLAVLAGPGSQPKKPTGLRSAQVDDGCVRASCPAVSRVAIAWARRNQVDSDPGSWTREILLGWVLAHTHHHYLRFIRTGSLSSLHGACALSRALESVGLCSPQLPAAVVSR